VERITNRLKGPPGGSEGTLLRGIQRTDIERGQVLSKPGTITPHTPFKAEPYKLQSRSDSGRLDDLL
jgi:elongation factor Tu